jgi:hypothetical protein
MRLELSAGTSRAETAPGVAYFDEVRVTVGTAGNRAPTITAPGAQTTVRGQPASLQIVASDLDGQTLLYTATGLPTGLTIAPGTGLISGTVATTASASNTVTVTVSDGSLATDATFAWDTTAPPPNRAPVVTTPATQTTVRGQTAGLQIIASDPDGQTLSYSATGLPTGLTINALTGLITGTVATDALEANTVTVTVSDGSLGASAIFAWNTTAPSGTPTLLADDFSGATLDVTKWLISTFILPYYGVTIDPLVGIAQTGGRLEITPRVNTSGERHRGIGSVNTIDLTGGSAQVQVTPANGRSDTIFALSGSGNNFLVFGRGYQTIWCEQIVAGTRSYVTIADTSTTVRYWRIRHDAGADTVIFETSPDSVTWTTLNSVVRAIPITALRVELCAGTFKSEAAPGRAIFDDVLVVGPAQAAPPPPQAVAESASFFDASTVETSVATAALAGQEIPVTTIGAISSELQYSSAAEDSGDASLAGSSPVIPSPLPILTPGIEVQFFRGEQFETFIATATDTQIGAPFASGIAPGEILGGQPTSILWRGRIMVPEESSYAFRVTTAGGARMWIDGALILNSWSNAAAVLGTTSDPLLLDPALPHEILLEYHYGATATPGLTLEWESGIFARTIVPAANLFRP